MLDSKTIEKLKSLARDERAFDQLREIVEKEHDKASTYKNFLELLESAVRNDYDSILITDLNLDNPGPRIVYVNDGFERMTGYSRDEVIGETPRILQGEKTDPAILKKLKEALQKGNSFFGQTVNYRKDGSEFINQWDIHPLINKKGEITHWVSYQHDITERKRAEKKLLETSDNFDKVYEESKKTFVDLKSDGTIIEANKAFREMLGYQIEEIKGKKIWELTTEKTGTALEAAFGASLTKELVDLDGFELLFRRKNGLPVQAEMSLHKLSSNGSAIIRGDVNNVTLRNNVLNLLQKRNNTFNKLFHRKNDFNYGFRLTQSGTSPEITWISDGFEKLTGYKPDECKGTAGLNKLIHPDDLHLATEHYKTVRKGKSSCQQFRIVTRSGDTVPVMDYSKPDTEVDGEFKSAVVAVENDSSLKTV